MDFEFSDDQEMLRESVRRFLSERAPLAWVREMYDDPRGTTDEVWGGVVDLGLTGILVAEEHGGLGMGMVDMGVVLEEMGRAVHPGPFLSSAVGAATLADGSLLPGIATGEIVGAAAIFEPGRRIEWRRPLATASETGVAWAVDGTKVGVLDGQAADVWLVTAQRDDDLGVFAVERGADGVTVEPDEVVDGSHKQATVTFAGAPARPIEHHRAADVVGLTVDRLLTGLTVEGVGAASAALHMSVEYAKERVQFGHPIGAFQAIQHLCAEMLRDLELARAGAYYALWACDEADADTRHEAATMAKAWGSDALYRIGADTIQVHGGIGFTWEHDAHLYLKRLMTVQQAFGGATDHLEELARGLLD